MGGTSTDVSLVADGRAQVASDRKLAGQRVGLQALDIVSVGAGGGSIARVDAGGVLHVGPESAGADPGPACYGKGGAEATVTDANLVLGFLDPDNFLGGRARLDRAAAEAAVDRIAQALGVGRLDAALGIHRIVNTRMAEGIRLVSVRRGVDPRRFALLAFGGAAALHVTEIARQLELTRVVVPRLASVLSAWGMLASDLRYEVARSHVGDASRLDADALRALYADLEAEGRRRLEDAAFAGEVRVHRFAEMRYGEQIFEVGVDLDGIDWQARDLLAQLAAAFHRRHEELYTYALPDQEAVLVNARVAVIGRLPALPQEPRRDEGRRRRRTTGGASGSATGTRPRSSTSMRCGPARSSTARRSSNRRPRPPCCARAIVPARPSTAGSTSRSRAHADPDCALRRDLLPLPPATCRIETSMTAALDEITRIIAQDIGARPEQVRAAVALLDEGSTVPFIARYRKEATGGLDDGQLRQLEERLGYLRELGARRETIRKSIEAQGKLTEELAAKIAGTATKAELEDLYLPFKPKRRTKGADRARARARAAGRRPAGGSRQRPRDRGGRLPRRRGAGHQSRARGCEGHPGRAVRRAARPARPAAPPPHGARQGAGQGGRRQGGGAARSTPTISTMPSAGRRSRATGRWRCFGPATRRSWRSRSWSTRRTRRRSGRSRR